MSVEEAVAGERGDAQIRIAAELVTEDGAVLLCDYVLESDPVQCARPILVLEGAPVDGLGLTERQGELSGRVDLIVRWLDGDVVQYVEHAD